MIANANPLDRSEAIARSGWGLPIRFYQPHNPAFWLYWGLVIIGAYLYYAALRDYSVKSGFIVMAVALQVLYALPFLWFITRADRYEREPAKLCLLGFLWGGLVATWVMSAPANGHVLSIYAKLFGVDFATSWGAALTAPFTEESSKYAGLVMLVLLARPHVRSTYDGMLLGAFVGLGFQVFENVEYILGAVEADFGAGPAALKDGLFIFGARGFTGLWSHALYTAIAGAGLGYFLGATDRTIAVRLSVAAAFYLVASFIHATLDAVLAIGAFALPITVLTGTIGLVVAWRFADRRQRRWMRQLLDDELPSGTVTEEELNVLAGPRKGRSRFLRAIKRARGRPAARQAGHILDAQIDLAAAIAATGNPAGPEAERARTEVKRVRALLAT